MERLPLMLYGDLLDFNHGLIITNNNEYNACPFLVLVGDIPFVKELEINIVQIVNFGDEISGSRSRNL